MMYYINLARERSGSIVGQNVSMKGLHSKVHNEAAQQEASLLHLPTGIKEVKIHVYSTDVGKRWTPAEQPVMRKALYYRK